jgi:Holliday junction DNA helicase RuvA
MIDYLKGKLVEKSPTHAIVECAEIGYFVNISVTTYGLLPDTETCLIWTHFIVREDTARMILSGMNPNEVRSTIQNQNADALKGIKGIGAKSAQRIIVDLHDKISGLENNQENITFVGNSIKNDALIALSSLGFDKTKTDKTLDKLIKAEGNELSVERLIKLALKQL